MINKASDNIRMSKSPQCLSFSIDSFRVSFWIHSDFLSHGSFMLTIPFILTWHKPFSFRLESGFGGRSNADECLSKFNLNEPLAQRDLHYSTCPILVWPEILWMKWINYKMIIYYRGGRLKFTYSWGKDEDFPISAK